MTKRIKPQFRRLPVTDLGQMSYEGIGPRPTFVSTPAQGGLVIGDILVDLAAFALSPSVHARPAEVGCEGRHGLKNGCRRGTLKSIPYQDPNTNK